MRAASAAVAFFFAAIAFSNRSCSRNSATQRSIGSETERLFDGDGREAAGAFRRGWR